MSRSRTSALVFAGIALTVLLGVVALVSRGHAPPVGGGAENRGASQAIASIVFTVWALGMGVGALLLAWTLAQKRRARDPKPYRIRPALTAILFFAFVLVALLIAQRQLRPHAQKTQSGAAKAGKALSKAEQQRLARRPQSPSFEWQLAVGIIALIIGAGLTAVIRAKARRSELNKEVTLALELQTLLDETLDDLRNEADPRKAVIAAYARMEKVLAVHGLPRNPSEAPLEYLERVLAELRVSQPAVERLTKLFERAKFSEHEIGPELKEEAIEALFSLREQVRVIDSVVEPPELARHEVPKPLP